MVSNEQENLAREWAERVKAVPEIHYGLEANAAADLILTTTEPEIPELKRWDGVEMDGREWVVQAVSETGALQLIAADGSAYAHDFAESVTPNGKRYKLVEVTEVKRPVEPSTKTMDEYAPEERADMIGMWAEYRRGGESSDFVIIEGEVNQAGRVPCYNPGAPEPSAWAPDPWMLTPRFDIPRAWGTDGNPELREVGATEEPAHPAILETVEAYDNAPEGTIIAAAHGAPWVKEVGEWWVGDRPATAESIAYQPRFVLRWGWGE